MAIQQYPLPKSGIPGGNTAARPSSPVIGDTFYNGQLGLLEIYDGTNWIPSSAPAATPSVVGTDVGTGRAYTSGAVTLTFTPGINGGISYGYTGIGTINSTNYTTGTTTATTATLTVGGPGVYALTATAYNGFGTSPASLPSSVTVTTVPEGGIMGTPTTSGTTTDVVVNWTIGNTGGKVLTSQTVTAYAGSTPAATSTVSTSATSTTISGLTQGTAYTFKVKATNANGTGLEGAASPSVTIPVFVSVGFTVVGGGGSGGSPNSAPSSEGGGGGGAGGVRSSVTATGGSGSLESAQSLGKSTNFTVTVGAGAAGNTPDNVQGSNGSNSVFNTITSLGGGGGGRVDTTGNSGGSGGGGGSGPTASGAGGAGTSNQGYNGGGGNVSAVGGGGGGASANGTAGSPPAAGPGGAGRAISITGSSVTYGGGGGGGYYDNAGVGAGGAGGGGNGGGNGNNGIAGTANTGGGGGGGSRNGGAGGAGGSGVVILRWLTADGSITVGAGLTADATGTDGSYSYKRFTAGSGNVSFS